MKEILILTHGDFGKALIKSAEMIVGEMENVKSFGLQPGVSPEDFIKEVMTLIDDNTKEYFVLVDLFGGTPFHAAMYLTKNYDVNVITGVNLPLLVEIHNQTVHSETVNVDAIIEEAKESLRVAKL